LIVGKGTQEGSGMKKVTRRGVVASITALGGLAALGGTAGAAVPKRRAPRPIKNAKLSAGTDRGEWRTYGGDLESTRYAPLDQINAGNFNRLEPAFSFRPEDHGLPADPVFQATPLMVKGVLYFSAGGLRSVIAADARTGAVLWRYDHEEGERAKRSPRTGAGHGVSYWSDGKAERILYVTIGYQLICLDAKTGQRDATFGTDGVVDLKLEDDQQINLDGSGVGGEIGLHSTPLVVGDVIVVGAAHSATNTSKTHIKGYVRGFDVRSGKRLWIFHTVPRRGEEGYETWGEGSADFSGNTGNWAQNSADPELGLVYLSIEQPTGDYYGGFRPGANLFADCITAVDARTGERVWYYQTVHHDVWDRDIMCAPIMCDLKVGGKTIKALCQFTKQALTFVLNRETGEPVWPIVETPVPRGDIPGEAYWPTQPIPSRPPPVDMQGITENDLIDFTPELRAQAVKLVSNYRIGPLFEPGCVSQYPGPIATIMNPANDGACQWPGGAFDPQTNMAYVFSNLAPAAIGFVPGDPAMTDLAFVRGTAPAPEGAPPRGRLAVEGMMFLKPPYGRITALDLNKGDIVWQIAHGETPDEVRNAPSLKGRDIPRTGSLGKVGVLVTKTLLIAGDGTSTTGVDGKIGAWLRAYDKATGHEVGQIRMPARVTGNPMTYSLDGRQYIAVGIADPPRGQPGRLAVFALPATGPA
jgi:quinoprotein glucose dehydrogenase